MAKRIREAWLSLGLSGLLTAFPTPAIAVPIEIAFGDILVTGQSENGAADPYCPRDAACDFLPGAKVFRVKVQIAQNVQTKNPLEINLIDDFFSMDDLGGLTEEEIAHLEQLEESAAKTINKLTVRVKQTRRELRTKRKPPRARITAPSIEAPEQPYYFELDYAVDDFIPPYLVLNVVDSVTGEFSDIRIQVVPEPAGVALMGIGLLGMLAFRQKWPPGRGR